MTDKTDKKEDSSSAATATATPTEKKLSPDQQTMEDIREQIRLLERGVATKESRFTSRVLRGLFALRKRLSPNVLRRLVNGYYTHSAAAKDALLKYVAVPQVQAQLDTPTPPSSVASNTMEEEMDTDSLPLPAAASSVSTPSAPSSTTTTARLRAAKSAMTPLLPEVDCYLHLLVLLRLLQNPPGAKEQARMAVECAEGLMAKVGAQNRRSLDPIAARCYFYYVQSHERLGQSAKIRGFLHSRLRTATLRNDFEGQAVIINCLLRCYVSHNLYDQAYKLVNKATFPESASNNEWARYLYYLGRIKAIQLEYSEAHKHLVQSLRKAPQSSALGFRLTVLRLNITVELLLGEIPDRQVFLHKANRKALAPYLQMTQAVRSGDVKRFQDVLDRYADQFKADHTYTLILRLHHNVIKTAVRMISLAYSRISLADVAQKLRLESSEDAEYIVAKAIRDGVIEAVLDHENGWMQSKENTDIYCTREPQLAFHQRIEFCLGLRNSSVKAMRFPPKSYNQDLESAEDRREREAQDLELAKEMAEDDEDMI